MTLWELTKRVNTEIRPERFDEEKHYTREGEVHCTSSAFLVNETLDKALVVYHNIYDSYTWVGGHNDGERDFLSVAKREAMEETGISALTLFSSKPVHLGFLPVKEHVRRGETVKAHTHLNVTFAFLVSERETIRVKEDENSDVRWIKIDELCTLSKEPHMIPVFRETIENLRSIANEKRKALLEIPEKLLPWYDENKRDLPWRKDKDAYRVWVSEIMLQQTRVEAGKAYFERFMRELPTVYDLATCSEEKLMKLWEGLGYYNRARNMQKTAKLIAEKGEFPRTKEELVSFPGIGAYTAGAVASIAFDQKEPAVDGNVVRVLSRITEEYRVDPKELFSSMLRPIYPDRAGDFTQSLMELGATVCLPNGDPLCERCPMRELCQARKNGTIDLLPVLPKKREREKKNIFVYCIRTPNGVALRKRTSGVLKGMWEFPSFEEECLSSLPIEHAEVTEIRTHTHIFTHVEWNMTCYFLTAEHTSFETYREDEIRKNLSIPSAFRWILK